MALEGYHFIAVEGPIGVGKTRLAKALAARFAARLVLEPADKNPFLEKFYGDMRKYALATQIVFLVARYQQQAELSRRYLFHPLAVSDYILAKDRVFAGLVLTEDEFRIYDQLYEVLSARAARPDLVVLLRADPDTLLQRIRHRGIPYELSLPREYLERLVAAYDGFFRIYAESPLLIVETAGIDYARGGLNVEQLVGEMEKTRAGTRVYTPEPATGAGTDAAMALQNPALRTGHKQT